MTSLEPDVKVKSLDDWCEQQNSQPMFKFWFTVLQLQLTVLVFVRSIRTANFQLYVQSLTKLVPWFFSLDHFNYSRWISVHLRDMVTLAHLHPNIYTEFVMGNLTVRKTDHSSYQHCYRSSTRTKQCCCEKRWWCNWPHRISCCPSEVDGQWTRDGWPHQ